MIGLDDAVDDEIILVFEFVDSMVFVEMIKKLLFVEIVILSSFESIIDAVAVENPWVETFTAFRCSCDEAMSRLGWLTNDWTCNLAIVDDILYVAIYVQSRNNTYHFRRTLLRHEMWNILECQWLTQLKQR